MHLLTAFTRTRTPTIAARVVAEGLTYLPPAALGELHRTVQSIERRRLPGMVIEAGCALGGSAIDGPVAFAHNRFEWFMRARLHLVRK